MASRSKQSQSTSPRHVLPTNCSTNRASGRWPAARPLAGRSSRGSSASGKQPVAGAAVRTARPYAAGPVRCAALTSSRRSAASGACPSAGVRTTRGEVPSARPSARPAASMTTSVRSPGPVSQVSVTSARAGAGKATERKSGSPGQSTRPATAPARTPGRFASAATFTGVAESAVSLPAPASAASSRQATRHWWVAASQASSGWQPWCPGSTQSTRHPCSSASQYSPAAQSASTAHSARQRWHSSHRKPAPHSAPSRQPGRQRFPAAASQ